MSEPLRHQTVDLVEFPPYGKGRLVWKNGPARFLADSGEETPLFQVSPGGASKERGSWRTVMRTPSSEKEQVPILSPGENHERFWSPVYGEGWLVFEPLSTGGWIRFEDEKEVRLRFAWTRMAVGRPQFIEKDARSRRGALYDDPDEPFWRTIWGSHTMLSVRRGGPPPPEGSYAPLHAHEYQSLSSKAKSVYDRSKKALPLPGI